MLKIYPLCWDLNDGPCKSKLGRNSNSSHYFGFKIFSRSKSELTNLLSFHSDAGGLMFLQTGKINFVNVYNALIPTLQSFTQAGPSPLSGKYSQSKNPFKFES